MLRRAVLPVVLLAGLLVLVGAGPAAAHPGLIPPTVPTGRQTLTVAVPSEPPAGATTMTGIDVALPDGVTALSAQAGSTFPSVTVGSDGHAVQARGGSLPVAVTGFLILAVDITRTGSLDLVVTTLHDNGATTVWDGAPGTDLYSPPLVVTTSGTVGGAGLPTPALVGGGVLLGAVVLVGGYELGRRRRLS